MFPSWLHPLKADMPGGKTVSTNIKGMLSLCFQCLTRSHWTYEKT